MNAQEEKFFKKLSEIRHAQRKLLDSYALRGVEKSVVDKYSDEAHFIYELLQNADDACATEVSFKLEKDKLLFFHNGTRHFTLSNPETEDEDFKNGTIGDINAITAIGGSNKNNESTIGKFGVGFKAVFQYTKTPQIYDPVFHFKIDDFIVPVLFDHDYKDRSEDITLFIFPFNRYDRSAAACYSDIKYKLINLDYPMLFLNNIRNIDYSVDNKNYTYSKNINSLINFNDITAQLIKLEHLSSSASADDAINERLWLFTRITTTNLKYSIGFFIDNTGKLIKKSHPAFCYFPTKEQTNLNFIIHAPFLLTDSREGIRAGEKHNIKMVSLLARLAADSLEFLKNIGIQHNKRIIDDDIIDIIPYNAALFEEIGSKSKISFLPFHKAILNKFQNIEIIPTSEGYVKSSHAYWADEPQLPKLFSNNQLAVITNDEKARWAFPSKGRQNTIRNRNPELREFVDSITYEWLDEDDILKGWSYDNGIKFDGLNANFIGVQPFEWLDKLYAWILESKSRTEAIKTKPIFLDTDNNAVAIFNDSGNRTLFLPGDYEGEYTTIHPELYRFDSTKDLLKRFDVSKPSLKDQIFTKILPLYDSNGQIDTLSHFKIFFKYYMECSKTQAENLINKIKEVSFLCYNNVADNTIYRCKGSYLYYPCDDIKNWFIGNKDIKYLCLDIYDNLIDDNHKSALYDFFNELGVNNKPRLIARNISRDDAYKIKKDWPYSTRYQEWKEIYLEGSDELLKYIVNNLDEDASLILWNKLIWLLKSDDLDNIFQGKYRYFYYSPSSIYYTSSFFNNLLKEKWLINYNNIFVSPSEISLNELHEIYKQSPHCKYLCEKLGIKDKEIVISNLDLDESKLRNSLEAYGKSLGLSDEEQRLAMKEYANRKANQVTFDNSNITNYSEDDVLGQAARKLERIHKKLSTNHSAPRKDKAREDAFTELDEDVDEYIPPSTNLARKMDQVKRDAVKELENLAELENLQKQLAKTQQYTFGWLQTLLELENREIGQNFLGSREISISFGKIERDEGTQRTLILKQPSRYIPQMMEDLTDIPLELNFANGESLKLPIEVINIKSYTLRIKVRPGVDLIGIPFEQVTSAHIEAQSPTFLFAELRKSIFKLAEDAHWTENFNIRDNLVKNMDFVFGPPGTGKSTWLANHILDLVTFPEQQYSKILVLAPTNKAADVLVRRVIACLPQDSLIPEWLVRFGVTGDNEIEQKGILKPKNFDIRKFPTIVTVTTIARFPYDYFLLNETTRLPLKSIDWDYVIIDEASMIHLPYIIYPLYKSKPKKFIIAGDPFQIQPIASIDTWKDENIYTLVGLNSFSQPNTLPVSYNVHCLTTQYRALPKIGELFSKFTYDNILIHYRNENSAIPIPYNSKIAIDSLNIVKFPVRKYESIYRPQRLKGSSPYHIYSAIFSFELVKYLSSLDWQRTASDIFRIGVIAPYRAQADIVSKLVEGTTFPDKIDIQVGTIHGFQGDECEVILALFNPPPYISTSGNTFLNNRNIINVAISRARDYLFIVMPDDETIGVDDLHLIKNIESLCISQGCNIIESMDIENSIFGKRTYLEDNSFTTSHQDVNVYRTPELKYEIRCESMAVDLQIHNDISNSSSLK